MARQRLDELLVSRGLVENRSKARALIMAGQVLVYEIPVDKAGTFLNDDAVVRLKEQPRFVSRGGIKLEKALKEFGIDVSGKICLDVGASTGGFTDCLLKHGAKKVWAIDVGKHQLHWSLKTDSRVISLEEQNFRHFETTQISNSIDIAVMDVSFISVKLLIPKIIGVFKMDHGKKTLVALIKPQFEVGRESVGKGGIVKDAAARDRVVRDIVQFCIDSGLQAVKVIPSPITGADGNIEYFLCGKWPAA